MKQPMYLAQKNLVAPNFIAAKQGLKNLKHTLAPTEWNLSATASECALHQLAPYIGKLKSTIAKDLISTYSKAGDLIVDPFSGSGTIPLEALLLGRRTFAADISAYAATLTMAKHPHRVRWRVRSLKPRTC